MFFRKKPVQRIARLLLATMLYCFCGGAEAADAVHDTLKKRAAIKTFAENLGVDPDLLLDPETPDERAQRIAQRRQETMARLKSQVCVVATEEEIAEVRAGFEKVQNAYLPDRVAGMVKAMRSLDKRLDEELVRAKQGRKTTFTGVELTVYHEAMARGQEDAEALIRVTEKQLHEAKMPQEIIDRTLKLQNTLRKEAAGLRKALAPNLIQDREARRRPMQTGQLSGIRSQVRQSLNRIRAEVRGVDPESLSADELNKVPDAIEAPPIGGGNSSGGGSGIGGGGGDDGQSGIRAKLVATYRNAGHTGETGGGGTGGDPVDLGNGVFMRDDIDFTVSVTGDVAGVRRRYRSNNNANGAFGHRWYHGYSIFLTEAGNGDVSLMNDDARQYLFPSEGEGKFGPTEELDAVLEKKDNQFKMETGGYVFLFDANGRFLSRGDSSKNLLAMVYDGTGKLIRVDDKDGKAIIEYTYNAAGYIESASGRGDRLFTYTYDENGNLLTATNADNEQISYTYYDNHLLASITNPEGEILQIFYDGDGRVHRQVDPEGNSETFSYDFINHTTVVTDGNGNSRSVVHDPNGRVKEAVDALGNRIFQTYDDRGRLTSVTDEFGRITTYEYEDVCDTCGVTKVTEPDGTITYSGYGEYGRTYNRIDRTAYGAGIASSTYIYDASGRLAGIQFSSLLPDYGKGGKLRGLRQVDESPIAYDYNDQGQVVRASSPEGLDIGYEYDEETGTLKTQSYDSEDADGNPVQLHSNTLEVDEGGLPTGFVDAAGKRYSTVTNARGMPTHLTPPDPGASPIRVQYDRNGLIQSVTRNQTIVTQYDFDGNGRNIVMDSPQTGREEKQYDGRGNVVAIKDAKGNQFTFEYNDINQQIRSFDQRGNPTDYLFCGNGDQPGGTVGPTGEGLLMEYDYKDRLVRTVDDNGSVIMFAYESGSKKPTLVVDGEGNETRSIFDGMGRLVEVIDALGNSTRYEYGPYSPDPTKVIDAENREWKYDYDALGRLIRETDPLNRTTRHYYDAAGNEIRTVDPDGRETTYGYDSWNRRIAASYPGGATASWVYTDGLLTEESSTNRLRKYEYDVNGRVSKMTDSTLGESLRYAYTETGQVKAVQDDKGNVTAYTYNEADQVIAIDHPGGKRVSYSYDEAGRRNRIWYPNGTRCEIGYDLVGHIGSLIYIGPDELPFQGQTFTYDRAGNILTERDHNANTTQYTYDKLYRIKEVRENGALVESLTYDKVGNILTCNRPQAGQSITYAYDAANQLLTRTTTQGQTAYTFDGAGRLTQKAGPEGIYKYYYEEKNRLARVELPGGQSVEYEYDAEGRLVQRNKGAEQTDYLIDREHVYADYESDVQARLYHRGTEIDELIGATPKDQDTQYYHQDHLMSVRTATGRFGDVEGQRKYWAYGETRSDSGTPGVSTRFGYAGREMDSSTGLIYNRARWFMPEAGRFLTLDEKRGEFTTPSTLHRYLYAMANPINYNDPTGFGVGKVLGTAFMDYLQIQGNIILGMAKTFVSCYSPIAALIVGFYDVYYAMIASLMDLLFTYGNVPGSDCAMQLLMIIHFICQILNIIAAATWTSCMSKIWEELAKTVISEAIKGVSAYIMKLVTDALKTGKVVNALIKFFLDYIMVALDIYLGLCSGVGIALGVIKLFMAPEICLGFCLLYMLARK